jgi:membrane protein implicated in regulation of membrane protease activity
MPLQLVLFVVLSLLTVLIGEREVRGVPKRAT